MPTDSAAEAANHPWVLYALIATGVGTIVLSFFPKVLPPLQKVIEQRAAIRKGSVDRRFADLDEQVEYLQQQLTEERQGRTSDRRELEAEMQRMRSELHDYRMRAGAHVAWDYERVTAAAKRGETIPDPPPLFAPLDPDEKAPAES